MTTNNRNADYYKRENHQKLARDDVSRSTLPTAGPPPNTAPSRMNPPTLDVLGTDAILATLAGAPPDGGSPITQYDLRYLRSGASWIIQLDITSPYTIDTLEPDTEYFVETRAVNAVGAAPWSVSASATTDAGATVPGKQSAPTLNVQSSSSIQVSWVDPPSDGGSPILDYSVRHSDDGGQNWVVVNNVSNSPYNLTGLSASTTYTVQTRARNSEGVGEWSSSANATTQAGATAPGTMGLPTCVALTSSQVEVTFSSDPPDGGSPITDYDVRYSLDSQSWTEVAGQTSPAVISNLTANSTYFFSTRANNAVGKGGWSPAATATTLPGTTVPGRMGTPTADSPDIGQLRITRGNLPPDGGSTITQYDFRYSDDMSNWIEIAPAVSPEIITGLSTGITYYAQNRAVNAIGPGQWSDSASAVITGSTVPDQMNPPTVTNIQQNSIDVVKASDPGDGGSPIISHDLRYKEATSGVWMERNTIGATETVGGLNPATEYDFQTRAVNLNGQGPWSTTTKGTTQAVAGQPAVISLTNWNSGTFSGDLNTDFPGDGTLVWADTAPGQTPGPSGGGWDIAVDEEGTQPMVADGQSIQFTPTTTGDRELHVYQLRTNNVPSNVVRQTYTRAGLPGQMSPPTITATTSDSLEVTLASDPSDGGSPITTRDIRYSLAGLNTWTEALGVTSPHNLTGLTADTNYDVQSRANNAVGNGPWSTSVQGRTDAAASGLIYHGNTLIKTPAVVAIPDNIVVTDVPVVVAPGRGLVIGIVGEVDATAGAFTNLEARVQANGASSGGTLLNNRRATGNAVAQAAIFTSNGAIGAGDKDGANQCQIEFDLTINPRVIRAFGAIAWVVENMNDLRSADVAGNLSSGFNGFVSINSNVASADSMGFGAVASILYSNINSITMQDDDSTDSALVVDLETNYSAWSNPQSVAFWRRPSVASGNQSLQSVRSNRYTQWNHANCVFDVS